MEPSPSFGPVTQALLPDARFGTLFLLRHGELESSERRLLRGQAEAALSARGQRQERTLVRWFGDQAAPLDAVYSSDLGRCQSLASALAHSQSLPLALEPRLREQDMGHFEGRDWEELSREFPREVSAYWADYAHTRPPGGENLLDVAARANAFLEGHAESWLGRRVALVTHAGVLRVLLCRMLELPIDRALRLAPKTGSVSVISHSSAGFVIEQLFLVPPEQA